MTKARQATATVTFVDEYAQRYQDLFPGVRSAGIVQVSAGGHAVRAQTQDASGDCQGSRSRCAALHHVVAYAPWSVHELRKRRLSLVRQALDGRSFVLCIDETGDRKKGKTTDYVAHQYIGNLGKLENGIVSVNAYGILDQITFPLLFKVAEAQNQAQAR